MRVFAIIGLAVLLSSCTSPHKTYQPPSNVKVTASTTKAHAAARKARTHVEAAQKHADAIAVRSLDIQQKLDALIKIAPPELQSALGSIKGDVSDMQVSEGGLRLELTGAYSKQNELETHLTDLESHQAVYYSEAQALANSATNEREALITTQKQLLQQRIFSLLWKIGGGAFILIIILVIVAWKLGWKAIKL